MNGAAKKRTALRASLTGAALPEEHVRVPLGHAAVDVCLKDGLRRGALHEVFALGGHEAAATGFAAALARRVCGGKHLLWIRQDFSALEFGELAAPGLLELGLDPEQVLFLLVNDATAALRAAGDALSCAALGAVVIEIPGTPKVLDLTASRRLTLASVRSGVTAFLLRFSAKPQASAAETRWLVRGTGTKGENWGGAVFEVELLRNRHGQTGYWAMEWNCDGGLFQVARQATHSGAVVSAIVYGQVAAAETLVA